MIFYESEEHQPQSRFISAIRRWMASSAIKRVKINQVLTLYWHDIPSLVLSGSVYHA